MLKNEEGWQSKRHAHTIFDPVIQDSTMSDNVSICLRRFSAKHATNTSQT
jgi:hypothetical protein